MDDNSEGQVRKQRESANRFYLMIYHVNLMIIFQICVLRLILAEVHDEQKIVLLITRPLDIGALLNGK